MKYTNDHLIGISNVYVIRCYRNFSGLQQICKNIDCYYHIPTNHRYGSPYREVWMTSDQYTYYKLLDFNNEFEQEDQTILFTTAIPNDINTKYYEEFDTKFILDERLGSGYDI